MIQLKSSHKHYALPLCSPVFLNVLHQLTHMPSFRTHARDAGANFAHWGSICVSAVSGVLMFMQQVSEVLGAAAMLLGAVVGFRWAIGRWDKMRTMWRADWIRPIIRAKETAEWDVEVFTALFLSLGPSLLMVFTVL